MKNSKKMYLTMIIVIIINLVGCSSSEGKVNKEVLKDDKVITIWVGGDGYNIKAAKIAKEMYIRDNPSVTVNVISVDQVEGVQKLRTCLSSGSTVGLPNIILIEDYCISNYLLTYPGAFKELSSIIDKSKFMEYKLGVTMDKDKIYCVPFDSGVAALFYRADYIEQAGYTKEDMKDLTWEKYIEIGKDVKKKIGKDMLTLNPRDLNQLRLMMQSAGSWYVDSDGKINIYNNQALRDSINIYKQMLDSNIAKTVSGWDEYLSSFQNGDVVTVPSGCWISSLIQAAENQKGKWAVASIPRIGCNPNSINISNCGGSSWCVLDKVGNSDLAADFLAKTFASSDELINALIPEINMVSTLKSAKNCENNNKPSEFYGGQEVFKDLIDWEEKIPVVNYGYHTYELEEIMAESMQAIVSGADIDRILWKTQARAEASLSN